MDSGRCSTSVTLHLLINTFPLYGNEVRGGQIGQHLFIYGVVQNSLCWIHPEPEGKLDSINHLISQMHLQYFFKVLWLLIPTFFLYKCDERDMTKYCSQILQNTSVLLFYKKHFHAFIIHPQINFFFSETAETSGIKCKQTLDLKENMI